MISAFLEVRSNCLNDGNADLRERLSYTTPLKMNIGGQQINIAGEQFKLVLECCRCSSSVVLTRVSRVLFVEGIPIRMEYVGA